LKVEREVVHLLSKKRKAEAKNPPPVACKTSNLFRIIREIKREKLLYLFNFETFSIRHFHFH